MQNAAQTDHPVDSDNASVGSGNSNLSTGALQVTNLYQREACIVRCNKRSIDRRFYARARLILPLYRRFHTTIVVCCIYFLFI